MSVLGAAVAPASQQMMSAPQAQIMSEGKTDLLSILEQVDKIHIKQTINPVDVCCGCNCQQNQYIGYSGPYNVPKDQPQPQELFWAQEESNCCERLCCCGKHAMKLELHPPNPGNHDPNHASNKEVWNTIERPGVCKGGKCCLGPLLYCRCPACASPCLEEMRMYKGAQGEVGAMNKADMIFEAKQTPCCEDICHWNVGIFEPEGKEALMKITAPFCFGGCQSLCLDDPFPIQDKEGQVGMLTKHSPDSIGACFREICTDADDYSVEFTPKPGNKATAEQKLAMLTGAFFADFTLFEEDPGVCYCESCLRCDFACNFCNIYCCGMFTPVRFRSKYIRRYYCCPCALCCPCCQIIPCCSQVDTD
jgi:hypothetical protein